jgi:hypothetical protein
MTETQPAPTSKPRPRPQRFFGIRFVIEGDIYSVSLLPIHPEVGRKAFRVAKLNGDKAVYDLRLTAHGLECQCMGYLRHGHRKQCETLVAASKVFDLS